MERSLTVLLPVEDAQTELAARVGRLLEVLPELTHRLEIVIIDDGSTDATIEVADELASRYPQVRAIRNSTPHGRARAIEEGLHCTHGDFVLLIDEDCCLPIDEIRLLWRAAKAHEIVLGRLAQQAAYNSTGFRRLDGIAHGGYQMLSRRAAYRYWNSVGSQATFRAELARSGVRWHEVEIRRSPAIDSGSETTSRPSRPNYLRPIRNFTLGE